MSPTSNKQYISFLNYSTSAIPSSNSLPSAKQDSLATRIKNRTIIFDNSKGANNIQPNMPKCATPKE